MTDRNARIQAVINDLAALQIDIEDGKITEGIEALLDPMIKATAAIFDVDLDTLPLLGAAVVLSTYRDAHGPLEAPGHTSRAISYLTEAQE